MSTGFERVVLNLALAAASLATATERLGAATILRLVDHGKESVLDADDGTFLFLPVAELQPRGGGHSGIHLLHMSNGAEPLVNAVSFSFREYVDATDVASVELLPAANLPERPTRRAKGITKIAFGAGESIRTGFRELGVGEYDALDQPFCTATAGYNNCSPLLDVERPLGVDALQKLLDEYKYKEGVGMRANRGTFEVLEAEYGPQREVQRFAVDFSQLDDAGNVELFGQLRYNSTVPIPEPPAACLCLGAWLAVAACQYRKRRSFDACFSADYTSDGPTSTAAITQRLAT